MHVVKANVERPDGGFTIIELITVIMIVGILASITLVSYNHWQQSITTAKLKSDLNGVVSAMENTRNFSNHYPLSTPSTFTSSDGVILSGGSIDGGVSYCVDASSSQLPGLDYHIDSTNNKQGAQPGKCPVTSTAVLKIRIYGPGTGKVVVTDGSFSDECVKTSTTDTTQYCQYEYEYAGGVGKTITSVIAYPDNSADTPNVKWRDYWQCLINSGVSLTDGALDTIDDDTFRVNFGDHTYSCGTAVW